MRIGVLEAGRVAPPLDAHGDYTHMFRKLVYEVASDVEVRGYKSTLGEQPEQSDECDAWIISGSAHCVHDDFDWLDQLKGFVSQLLSERGKTIGVCFGHQLIAELLGGEVEKARVGWCVGATSYFDQATDQNGEREVRLIASHEDQVVRMPEGARLTLSAASCPIAGFAVEDHVITVQGHPEFTPDFAHALYAVRREAIGEARYQQAVTSLHLSLDNLEIAREFVRFIRGG